ncbi:MAG: nucleotidyltransferase domain-containing protein [Cyclobacteriaceae bacterium]
MKLLEEIQNLILEGFSENLVFSFIGGSHAKGTAKTNSDVDAFVVLDKSDKLAEREFAEKFRSIHARHGITIEHYGEIFDLKTLENLVNFTRKYLSISEDIQASGCYHGDCLFSIFRKGDVVLKMLEEPKLFKTGDWEVLDRLETIAIGFFDKHPMKRIQLEKKNLVLSPENKAMEDRLLHRSSILRSPVGVDLSEWFNVADENLDAFQEEDFKPLEHSSTKRRTCPLLLYNKSTPLFSFYKAQCIVHIGTTIMNYEKHI